MTHRSEGNIVMKGLIATRCLVEERIIG